MVCPSYAVLPGYKPSGIWRQMWLMVMSLVLVQFCRHDPTWKRVIIFTVLEAFGETQEHTVWNNTCCCASFSVCHSASCGFCASISLPTQNKWSTLILRSEKSQCIHTLLTLTQLKSIMLVDVSSSLILSSTNSSKKKNPSEVGGAWPQPTARRIKD